MIVHDLTYTAADHLKEIIALALFLLPPEFEFTSAQFNRNAIVKPHVDKNSDWSITLGLGDYTGGALRYGDALVDVRHAPIHYNGLLLHSVEPYSGNRMSFTFFVHPRACEIDHAGQVFLTSLGFRSSQWCLPSPRNDGSLAPAFSTPSAQPQVQSGKQFVLVEIGLSVPTAAIALGKSQVAFSHFFVEADLDALAIYKKHCPGASLLLDDEGDFMYDELLSAVVGDIGLLFVVQIVGVDHVVVDGLNKVFAFLDKKLARTTSALICTDKVDDGTIAQWAPLLGALPIQCDELLFAPVAADVFFWLRGESCLPPTRWANTSSGRSFCTPGCKCKLVY